MNITLQQLTDWLNSFHDSHIKTKKPIRGRTFSGLKMEIYGDNIVTVVLTDPFLRGTTQDQKNYDFVRNLYEQNISLITELDEQKLISLINGTYQLTDKDWSWNDE